MKKVLFIVDHSNRFLQKNHRFDSLDVQYMKDNLIEHNFDVEILTFNEILNSEREFKNYNIIYTGSQMEQYKNYIENTMYHLKEDNFLIPRYEILKSHENKFFQELQNRKLKINTNIRSWLFGDIKEYQNYIEKNKLDFPKVIKGINGSASMNVKIVKDYEQSLLKIKEINENMVLGMNEDMSKKYDLFPEENINNRQFIVQEFIKLPNFDYRVHIMGDKYWGHKRTMLEDSEYTSGDGSINDFECDIPSTVLNYSKEIYDKLDIPHVIFDIVENEEGLYLIEWSALHLGCISLLNGQRYYKLENNEWIKYKQVPNLEDEYVYSWIHYMNLHQKNTSNI